MAGERGRVLVVEDDASSAELTAAVVEREGFEAVICRTAAEARESHPIVHPVAILLDWVLPDAPGITVCRELRAADPVVTIIFVSGRGDETSVARGLDAGADDFVTKPVREGELVARLEAQLRKVARLRAGAAVETGTGTMRLKFGAVEIDTLARQVRVNDKPVQLGRLQYRLLEYLARNAGVAVSREQILNAVYGIAADIDTDRVDVLVQRLRHKLGDYPDAGGHIIAHPGYGYLLEKQASGR